ncbi:unnamed protein product [Spirodela intermedia]|uniref:Uncharacterized protein n=1 Tax=Spirodela intermedia TaxID=51605 RepID=A0A7I8IYI8_SPIIN|nr:unnamed protein product [Spirodela intermedia]CAA6663055.1 unnamed protein product [Spirodela intermedia]
MFIKHSKTGEFVYVDDIIIIGNDSEEIKAPSANLSQRFEVKTLGKLKYFFSDSHQGIFIPQQKYILNLLQETGKVNCKPLGPGEDSPSVDRGQYQCLIGKLIYLNHTRPDIVFSVGLLSQFMHDPKYIHLQTRYKGSITDQRSTIGYCSFIGGNLVTWRAKKIKSSTAQGICEALWIISLLEELKVNFSRTIGLYCENKSVIDILDMDEAHEPT